MASTSTSRYIACTSRNLGEKCSQDLLGEQDSNWNRGTYTKSTLLWVLKIAEIMKMKRYQNAIGIL